MVASQGFIPNANINTSDLGNPCTLSLGFPDMSSSSPSGAAADATSEDVGGTCANAAGGSTDEAEDSPGGEVRAAVGGRSSRSGAPSRGRGPAGPTGGIGVVGHAFDLLESESLDRLSSSTVGGGISPGSMEPTPPSSGALSRRSE